MAKGVKKIKYIKGLIYPDMSVPNVRLTIKPDQWVWFVVSEWEAETTDKDKGRKLTWFRQSTDRKIILNKQYTDFNDSYGLRLPKKLCGSYHYYIEASLFGERDFRKQTGLYVKGWCTPKIVNSKWSKIYNGDDVRKTYQFSYGEDIFLHLETEGLNGDKIGIEIYRQKQGGRGTLDDQLIHIITNSSYRWRNKFKNR